MVDSSFLRSINIQLDVAHPERFEHFRPTSKSARLVSSLLDEKSGRALFVVAPYGSGKSITVLAIGLSVATLTTFVPKLDPKIKGPVLYLDWERSSRPHRLAWRTP